MATLPSRLTEAFLQLREVSELSSDAYVKAGERDGDATYVRVTCDTDNAREIYKGDPHSNPLVFRAGIETKGYHPDIDSAMYARAFRTAKEAAAFGRAIAAKMNDTAEGLLAAIANY